MNSLRTRIVPTNIMRPGIARLTAFAAVLTMTLGMAGSAGPALAFGATSTTGTEPEAPELASTLNSSWKYRSPMPSARTDLAVATVGDDVYAIGGRGGGAVLGTVESFFPWVEHWETRASMPSPREGPAAAVVRDKIYVIGGGNGNGAPTTIVQRYDPATNTWDIRASMSFPRKYFAAAAVGDRIYVFGGSQGGAAILEVEMYDVAADTWTTVTSVPPANISYRGNAVVDGDIYLLAADGSLLIYDPVTNTFRSGAPMPTSRAGVGAATLHGKIYVLGGFGHDPSITLDVVEVYDPVTDSWASADPMPTSRVGLGVATLNDAIFAIGGDNDDAPALNANESYAVGPLPTPPAVDPAGHQDLISFRPSMAVQNVLATRGFFGMHGVGIEKGRGVTNLDYYSVRITDLPQSGGRAVSGVDLMRYIQQNLNDFVPRTFGNGDRFYPYAEIDDDLWNSSDPTGSVQRIHLADPFIGTLFDEWGDVVTDDVQVGPDSFRWTFSTLWTEADGWHAVSGNRQFGIQRADNGTDWIIYARGADRVTTAQEEVLDFVVFEMQDRLWRGFQERVASYVNDHGGTAEVVERDRSFFEWSHICDKYWLPTEFWHGQPELRPEEDCRY